MSPEDSPLLDMLDAAKLARVFVEHLSEREFLASVRDQYAVVRALETIDEVPMRPRSP